jgi:hypothetical protein
VGKGPKLESPFRHAGDAAPMQMPDELEGRPIAGLARALFAIAGLVSTILALNQLLNLQLLVGVVFIENRYLFLLAAVCFRLFFWSFLRGDRRPTPGTLADRRHACLLICSRSRLVSQ